MTRTVVIYAVVHAELRRVSADYEQQKPGLGLRFERAVISEFKRIEAFPFLRGRAKRSVRLAPITKFPFGLLYSVSRKWIEIYSLIPTRSHPHSWQTGS